LYFKQGRLTEAVGELERAAKLLDDPVIFDHLGEAYFRAGDIQKAKASWEKSLELDSGQDEIKQKIERLDTQ
ncbi:MAG: tetratricopeptide repeat protein, partial [Candidatus Omnitrophica bacterium]|nr:tetratricopeptide repeat protein [Candidatus Omnitrophota bacterium]